MGTMAGAALATAWSMASLGRSPAPEPPAGSRFTEGMTSE